MRKMKNYLKTGILLFGISLLLWNCEKDTTTVIENQSIETDNSLSQDDISIELFDFEKFKEFPLYSQLDNFVKFNAKSRISKKKEHKFKIHKNTFKKITKKDIDYTSYTFLISDTENFDYAIVKNLVINQYKKNIEVFIFTYNSFDISDEHKYNINENVVIEQLFDFDISELGDLASRDGILIDGLGGDGTGDGEPSSGGGSSTYCYNVSIIIDYPCYGSGSLGTNHANCLCGTSVAPNCTQPHQEYYSEIFCTTEFNSSTTAGSYYISNNYSPTGGGGTPNVTTTNNDIIISSIIKNEIPEGADPLAFKLNLDSLSEAYNWLINPINVNEYNQIGLFLEENGFSTESKEFALLAIEAIINGGDVDYVDRIILDKTFVNNPKAICVYKKLKEVGGIKEILKDFFDTQKTANLIIKLEPNLTCSSPDPFGCTSFNISTQTATISIDEDFINQFQWNNSGGIYQTPLLNIAKVIIHEAIHAQFFYNRYQVNNNLPVSNLTFEELYEEYRNLEGWQHQFMADHYRNSIANALGEVHPLLNDQTYINYINNNYPDWTWNQIYNNMAWSGLTQTPAGITYLSNTNNANLYSLQNTDVAVNSNKTPNCKQ